MSAAASASTNGALSQKGGRKVRVLFINDTARNGGPGRSLFYILRFLDPEVIHRSVVLPRPGVISELYAEHGVTEDLLFERDLVENPIEPSDRPMSRDDFDAPKPTQAIRAATNVVRAGAALYRLTQLLRKGPNGQHQERGRYDLVYCNGTNACFAGGFLARAS